MLMALARNWWAVLLRGLVALILGVLALVWPGISIGVLVTFFGAYALADGAFAVVSAVVGATEHEPRWGLLLAKGLCGILAGLFTFVWPATTLLALMYLIGAWAIITGCLEIAAAIRLRRLVPGEWLLGLSGAASAVLGVLMLLWPGAGAVAMVYMLGGYGIVFGASLIGLSIRLRRLAHDLAPSEGFTGPMVHSSGAA